MKNFSAAQQAQVTQTPDPELIQKASKFAENTIRFAMLSPQKRIVFFDKLKEHISNLGDGDGRHQLTEQDFTVQFDKFLKVLIANQTEDYTALAVDKGPYGSLYKLTRRKGKAIMLSPKSFKEMFVVV